MSDLRRLRDARNAYGAGAERGKRALLSALRNVGLRTAADVTALHEDLLFLCAFPGSPGVRALARRMLDEIGERVRRLSRAQRTDLDDSGIAGSVTRHVLPFAIVRWLAETTPADVAIDWRSLDDPAKLDGCVDALLHDAEREGFDSGEFATRDWIALAKRVDAKSDVQWLAEAATGAGAVRLAGAWDDAEIPVAWTLRESRWSVTRNVLAGAGVALRTSMRRPPPDAVAEIARPLDAIERLPRRRARRVVAAARAALSARCREVNAMTYPNLDEVWWCDLGEGAALAVIGIAREHRLALETNTGYLLFANGVPIGYGGVTPLFRQANTGINVFDPFRGSEAAFLWTQMLRAFHTLYGSRRFVVNPYQFGAGNAEAIESGAFWFYYRLGFRPAQARTATLAAREVQRMAADRRYRSDRKTLRALASGDLHLDLPGFDRADAFDETLLPHSGALAARVLAREPAGSRQAAARRIAQRLAAELAIDDYARWPAHERRGFEYLAPIAAGVPTLREWDRGERDAVAAMLRAKGAPQERHYALKAQRAVRFHHALHATLARMAKSGTRG
ncbi:MAG: hypothetical protein U1F10_17755 [Burkholderiales bacterium]